MTIFVQELIGVTLKKREMFYALLTNTVQRELSMRNLISDFNPDNYTFNGYVPAFEVASESSIDTFLSEKAATYKPEIRKRKGLASILCA